MTIASWLALPQLSRGADAALLLTRVTVGAFLIWGVSDNILSAEDMAKFAAFLKQYGFPAPELMAPLGVAVQALCGALFVAGLATRWAGLLCALNFVIAIVMVDQHLGVRGAYPAWSLVLIGLILATVGPGRYALDARIRPAAE